MELDKPAAVENPNVLAETMPEFPEAKNKTKKSVGVWVKMSWFKCLYLFLVGMMLVNYV